MPELASVIVPTFNSGKLAVEAVRSALNQSWSNLEIIVVDDGSTDDTVQLLRQIPDPRLQIHCQANAGPAAAANAARRFVNGVYIALLDHDDLWAPEKLAMQLGVMNSDASLDMTFTWSRLIDETGRPSGLCSHRWHGRLSFAQMVEDFVIGNTSSVVIRRSAFDLAGEFDPSLRLYYDMDLFLRIAHLRPGNCTAIPHDLTFYRRHSTQISADWRSMEGEWNRLMGKLRPIAPPQALQAGTANMHRYFSFLAYERRHFTASLQLLSRCARLCPSRAVTDLRNIKLLLAAGTGLLLPRSVHGWLESLAGVRVHHES